MRNNCLSWHKINQIKTGAIVSQRQRPYKIQNKWNVIKVLVIGHLDWRWASQYYEWTWIPQPIALFHVFKAAGRCIYVKMKIFKRGIKDTRSPVMQSPGSLYCGFLPQTFTSHARRWGKCFDKSWQRFHRSQMYEWLSLWRSRDAQMMLLNTSANRIT